MVSESDAQAPPATFVVDLDQLADSMGKTNGTAAVGDAQATNGKHNTGKELEMVTKSKDGVATPDKDDSEKDKDSDKDGKDKRPRAKLLSMLRFATAKERTMYAFGVLAAMAHGAGWPVWSLLFGSSVGKFDPDNPGDITGKMVDLSILFCIAGVCVGAAAAIHIWIFSNLGPRQLERIRWKFVRASLQQELGWHDQNPGVKLDTMLVTGLDKMTALFSTKMGDCLKSIGQGIVGLIIAFAYGWKLAFAVVAYSPVLIACIAIFGYYLNNVEALTSKAYQSAAFVSNESLTLIKTIMQYSTYEHELDRYMINVRKAYTASRLVALKVSLAIGLPDFAIFSLYGICFAFGAFLIRNGDIDAGDILIILFSGMLGFMGFGQSLAHMQDFTKGLIAAHEVFKVIDRKSEIDGLSEEGLVPDEVDGKVEFRDVRFAYPSDPSLEVLHGVSFSVSRGQTIALVGSSGSGKSTIVSLLERFYDPTAGSILLGGRPIREYNLQWLRTKIGLVTQMPVLFPGTVYENIAAGKKNATKEDVYAAAKAANAHDFIEEFALGYETQVGELGGQLSGGQRQRIGIARVLINNPVILLLDEATSALDTESEAVVQEALENAQHGRTTITIAHRLTTVRNANHIVVLDHGSIKEQGSPAELTAAGGIYASMLEAQFINVKNSNSAGPDTPKVRRKSGANAGKGTVRSTKVAGVAEDGPSADDDDEAKLLDEKKKAEEDESHLPVSMLMKWAWGLSKPDIPIIMLSFVGSVMIGALWPAFSIVLSRAMNEALTNADARQMWMFFGIFFALAFVNLTGMTLRHSQATLAGERLTLRLREKAFWTIINQDASYFDHPEHSLSQLTQLLSSDIGKVRGLVAEYASVMVMIASILILGIGVAIFYCWRVGLVILACVPLLVLGGATMAKLMLTASGAKEQYMKKVKARASMALSNVRLITALGQANNILGKLHEEQQVPLDTLERMSYRISLTGLVSEFIMFGTFALAFWYGSTVVEDDRCSFSDMFTAMIGVLFSAVISGFFSSLLPNMKEARAGAARAYHFFQTAKDPSLRKSTGKDLNIPQGNVEFRNVSFRYPTRPNNQILKNFSLSVPAGKTVALVGMSGSGKSTIVGLLQHFYEIEAGQILIDGQDLKDFSVDSLRSQISVVSQEPRLFAMSVAENIMYGRPKDMPYTQEEMEAAAKKANAHNFISEFNDGYNHPVGQLGGQLSGGQRQRVVLSRIFLRDSKILLLDEATSALDTHSERLVQASMMEAAKGRTTIIIAHRLSTIRDADCIVVMDHGEVVEKGTHDELVALQGRYYDLLQQTETETPPAAD